MGVGVGVQPTHQPDRITGQVPPGLRVVIAVPVVVQAGLGVVVLAREAQVERQAAAGDRLTERPVVGFPGDGPGGIGQDLGRAQVIDVDLVDRIVGEVGQRGAIQPGILRQGGAAVGVDFCQKLATRAVEEPSRGSTHALLGALVVDVVGVAGGGAVHRGLDQPVVAVVDEAVLAALHEVAGGVMLVALAFGLEQPVVAAVDLVAVPLAVAEPRRAVGVVVVFETQGAVAAGGGGEAIGGVVTEGLVTGRLVLYIHDVTIMQWRQPLYLTLCPYLFT